MWNGSDTFVIVIVFLFIPPCSWPHKWPKHVEGCLVIKLHQNTIVHLLVLIVFIATSYIIWLLFGCLILNSFSFVALLLCNKILHNEQLCILVVSTVCLYVIGVEAYYSIQ